MEDIDFDFETGEIVEKIKYDSIGFSAVGTDPVLGPFTINHSCLIPTKHKGSTVQLRWKKGPVFLARIHQRMATAYGPNPEHPYSYVEGTEKE